jgi:RND family efflux transporter MFP subunit
MVESDYNIFLPAKSSGIVKKIHVTEGQKVSKGQILAELDGAILEHSIAELETNLELAKTVFERQQRLWDKKIGSEVQYLQAKTNKESLEKRLKALNEQYLLTKFIAPISGTVDQIQIKEGEAAAPGFGAIRIVKITDLKINSALSEKYIGQVKTGDPVGIEIPVLNKKFESTIQAVSQVIDSKNRTFSIEIRIPESQSDIRPNMLAVLTINNYSNPEALTVPMNIVQKSDEGNFLFTAQKSAEGNQNVWEISKEHVKTGLYYDDLVEIKDGLKEGDHIVIFGYQNLADGQKVIINEQD